MSTVHVNQKIDRRRVEELLEQHIEAITRGESQRSAVIPDAYPDIAGNLRALFNVAQLLNDAIRPVRPSKAFVDDLRRRLATGEGYAGRRDRVVQVLQTLAIAVSLVTILGLALQLAARLITFVLASPRRRGDEVAV